MADRDAFAVFVDASSRGLLRAAWLLTGDWALAEDDQLGHEFGWESDPRAHAEIR